MAQNGVCAVIITFHPLPEVLVNLAKVRPQVEHMIVVDNGSRNEELAPFHEGREELQFSLIENGENLGIAAALNIGVRWAQTQGCEWVVLFDQDSTVTAGFIDAMLLEYRRRQDKEKIAILVPQYIDRNTRHIMPLDRTKRGDILVARTSGSLVPLTVFQCCGWFQEDLVIDLVDWEYCLRVGVHGYKIAQCDTATLIHSLGERKEHHFRGWHLFIATHHNAKRRYYMCRNRVLLARMYWRSYPRYSAGLIAGILKESIKIVLVDDDRIHKIGNSLKGLLHGILGRTGQVIKL